MSQYRYTSCVHVSIQVHLMYACTGQYRIKGIVHAMHILFFEGRVVSTQIKTGRNSHATVFHTCF